MKITFLLPLFLLAVLWVPTAAQNQIRNRRVTDRAALRNESAGPKRESNHFDKKSTSDAKPDENTSESVESASLPTVNKSERPDSSTLGNAAIRRDSQSARAVAAASMGRPDKTEASGIARQQSVSVALTEEYRVGIGDVLDIRLEDMPTQESTLFTVVVGGFIEYPLLSQPLRVVGLTTDEILERLTADIKVIRNPRVFLKVREYYSHRVIVNGAVENPGGKPLRREAMPLYAVLAAAIPRAEATSATIVRAGKAQPPLALSDQKAMSTLIMPGDIIRIAGKSEGAKEFFYAGGQIVSPGEKSFRTGMTLTQALLACGGKTREAGKGVKISRRNTDGFLVTSEYDLRGIEEGKALDPLLQAGDRIEVERAM